MKDLKAIVGKISTLKPLPHIVHRVMAVIDDPERDMYEISEIISHDPVMTATLLKGANSAYYGRPGKFENVHQAVVFLGAAEVVSLVLMVSSKANFSRDQKGYDLQEGELWRYSLCSAFLAKAVAARKGMRDQQFIFTAALLKDIGKVVLSQHVSEQLPVIEALVKERGMSFREAEKAVLGIDHAELGSYVARVWQFSPKMTDLIKHHHQPLACQAAPKEAAAVYMGDVLCMMLGIGGGGDGLAYRFSNQAAQVLHISAVETQQIMAQFMDKMDCMKELFSI